jgi:4-hydroxybenzoate polyprenyltransferase
MSDASDPLAVPARPTLPLRSNAWGLVVLATPRFLPRVVVPFAVGVLANKQPSAAYLALGVTALSIGELASNLANICADREGDAIDYPSRTRLARRVTYARIERVARVGAVLYLALVVGMIVVVELPVLLGSFWVVMLAAGFGYSRGPRVKSRRLASPVLLASIAPACLAAGFTAQGSVSDVLPWLVLLLLFRTTTAGGKDVNNVDGDTATAYRSVYHLLIGGRRRGRRALVFVTIPFFALGAGVAANLLPARALLVGLLWPLGLAYAWKLVLAESARQRDQARELSYLYEFAVTGAVLLAFFPELVTVLLVVGSFVWFAGATRFAHPEPGLSTWWCRRHQTGRVSPP